jgi:Kelch motif/F-box domain
MGALWSQPNIKTQAWEKCPSSSVDTSKRLRMTLPQAGSLQISPRTDARLIPSLPDEISLQILARVPRAYYLNLRLVSWSWRNAVTDSEIYRLRKELGRTEEWLYVLTKGGDNKMSWHAFDPINSIWQKLPLMPNVVQEEELKRGLPGLMTSVIRNFLGKKDAAERVPYCGCAIGVVNGCLYVLGGFSKASALKSVLQYNPCTNSWNKVCSMSTGRAFCKTSLLNNKIYVVGGVSRGTTGTGGLTPLRSAEVYNPDTDTWTEVPSMPFSKAETLPAAFLVELLKPIATGMTTYRGKLCVPQSLYSWPFFVDVGGEVFDPVTNSWAEMPAGMGEGWPARQASSKLSTVLDGELYALDPSTSSDDSKIKMYDHHEDAWKVVTEKVPFRDCTDTEAPYLLTGLLGKLHVIAKDVTDDVKVFQMKLRLSSTDSCSSVTAGGNEVDIWEVISATKIAGAELISCQVLSI